MLDILDLISVGIISSLFGVTTLILLYVLYLSLRKLFEDDPKSITITVAIGMILFGSLAWIHYREIGSEYIFGLF